MVEPFACVLFRARVDESFEAGLVIADRVEELPAVEVDEGVVVSLGEEIEAGEFGVVGIEENAAAELVGLGNFVEAIGFALDTNVDVLVTADEGIKAVF